MSLSIKKIQYISEKNQLLFFVLVFRVSPDHAVLQSLLPFMRCRPATTLTLPLTKSLSHPITHLCEVTFLFNTLLETSYRSHRRVCVYAISVRLFLVFIHTTEKPSSKKSNTNVWAVVHTLFGKLFY